MNDLVREITSLWQTDELRRRRPSALDGVFSARMQIWIYKS